MRIQGTIISWNSQKGFGFVKPVDDGKEVFIHIKEFNWRPEVGQTISFILAKDIKGRPCGKVAMLSNDILPPQLNRLRFMAVTFLAFAFLVTVTVFAMSNLSNYWIPLIYAGLSFVTFIVYWVDKSAAQNGSRRISEKTLHLLALFGGWPGALLAQQKLRHKTKKQPFRWIFWMTVVGNLGVLYWFSNQAAFL